MSTRGFDRICEGEEKPLGTLNAIRMGDGGH